MTMRVLYPFNYPGNKVDLLFRVNDYKGRTDTWYELFAGSAVVAYNIQAKHKVVCEVDPNVYELHLALQTFDYADYEKLAKFISSKWDLEKADDYYAYRDWFNATLWQTQHKKMGLGLLFLAGACMNALLRFGPSGFNQSSGLRQRQYSKQEYEALHSAANDIQFVNDDYRNLTIPKTATVFADPPYVANKCGTYDSSWTKDDLRELLKAIRRYKFFYTDTENSVNESFSKHLGVPRLVLKAMLKQSPGGKEGQVPTGRNEILMTNLKTPSIFD